jgi:hypothetical protein
MFGPTTQGEGELVGLAGGPRGYAYWVRVLDGPNKGKEGWVHAKNVKTE